MKIMSLKIFLAVAFIVALSGCGGGGGNGGNSNWDDIVWDENNWA